MIERKMTLAVIVTILFQMAAALLWAGAAGQRLKTVEGRIAAQEETSERLARVEVRLEMAAVQLSRIEQKLDGAGR